MQGSNSELIKLSLPKIIVNYFELTSYKKIIFFAFLSKEINPIPKEYGKYKLSSKGCFVR